MRGDTELGRPIPPLSTLGAAAGRGDSTSLRRWRAYYEAEKIVQEHASLFELKDAEPAVLERMVDAGLARMSMLDIGVGAGRTTLHFAPRAAAYLGIDIANSMIAGCRSRFSGPGWGHTSFEVCDVRDMRMLERERFDFVLFSWNGLDMAGGEEMRLKALREIERVCAPGATFCFSSHNLASVRGYLSFRDTARRIAKTRPSTFQAPLAWVKGLAETALVRTLNPSTSKLDGMASAVLFDKVWHGYGPLRNYFIRPREQFRQLEGVGFREPVVLTVAGTDVAGEALESLDNHWLYYMCRK
jgi:ubiquinone/menaquinone biosynthesis C-methylase UbiE